MSRVPELMVERLALGELPPDQAQQIRRALEAEVGGLERLANIEHSNREILQQLPAAAVALEVRRRAVAQRPQEKPVKSRGFAGITLPTAGLVTAVAAAALVVVLSIPGSTPPVLPTDAPDTVRLKGHEPQVRVYRQTNKKPERLHTGDLAHAGDLLQLSYIAAGAKHGVLLSVDGRGAVTLHFPYSSQASTELDPNGENALKHAYRLDNAPDFERFIFVASDEPIDPNEILDLTEQLGQKDVDRLDLSKHVKQSDLLVRKDGER